MATARKKARSGTDGPSPWMSRIVRKLESVRVLTGARVGYRPCADEATVQACEARLGGGLPADYREFVRRLGNGGPGPWDAGILPLENDPHVERGEAVIARSADDAWITIGPRPDGDVGCFAGGSSERISLGAFGTCLETWIDDELLADALTSAVRKALAEGRQLPRAKHAVVVREWAALQRVERPARARAMAMATVALYLGDRAAAEKLAADVYAAQGGQVSLDGAVYALMRALHGDGFADAGAGEPARIARAAAHASPDVRLAVTRNPRATDESLALLADDVSRDVRLRAVTHPAASGATAARVFEGTARRWADDPSATNLFALEAAARHPLVDATLAAQLCALPALGALRPWALRAGLGHPTTDAGTLDGLAAHAHPAVRHAVASHPNASPETVAKLARDPDAEVRTAVAFRFDAAPALLAELARDADDGVLRAVAWNPRTPTSAVAVVLSEACRPVLSSLVMRRDLPADARALLELHPWCPRPRDDWPEAGFIDAAGNLVVASRGYRYSPPPGRRRFRPDAPAFAVWDEGAYAHPSFPVPLLAGYVDEHYGNGGCELAGHPWLDDALFEALATATAPEGLCVNQHAAVARRPRLPLKWLERLLRSPSDDVRAAAAANPQSASRLPALARDPAFKVRVEVADHRHASDDLLTALTADAEKNVREVSTWRLRARRASAPG